VVVGLSTESPRVRASRGICTDGESRGAIVVRAMLDYRALPFIATQSPSLASLHPERGAPAEAVYGRDVEFALYGWSRAPIYAVGRACGRSPTKSSIDGQPRVCHSEATVDRGAKPSASIS